MRTSDHANKQPNLRLWFDCGCKKHIKTLEDALEHAAKEKHIITVHGVLVMKDAEGFEKNRKICCLRLKFVCGCGFTDTSMERAIHHVRCTKHRIEVFGKLQPVMESNAGKAPTIWFPPDGSRTRQRLEGGSGAPFKKERGEILEISKMLAASLIVALVVIVIWPTKVHAEEIQIIPYVSTVSMNDINISSPQKLDLQLPSQLIIKWKNDNISGTVVGILERNTFSILRVETSAPLKKEVKVCEIRMRDFTLQVIMSEIPLLDMMVKVNNEKINYTYDLTTKMLTIRSAYVALPAQIDVHGELSAKPYLNFTAIVHEDGSLEIKKLWTMVPQQLSIKVIVDKTTGVIPISIGPMTMKSEETESASAGYEVFGRPLGYEGVIVGLKILDESGLPITAKVIVMYDEEEHLFVVNGSSSLILPRDRIVKINVSSEGYRPEEKVIKTTSNMDVEIRLKKAGLWDQLMNIISTVISHLISNPLYLAIIATVLMIVVALVVLLRR